MSPENSHGAEKPTPKKPAHTIRRYGIELAIWRNEGENGPWYNVTLNRRYKQGEEWKDSGSFNADDLLPLSKMAYEADTWIQADRKAA